MSPTPPDTVALPGDDLDDLEEAEPGEVRRLVVPPEAAGTRLDRYLAAALPDLSRSQLQGLIEQGQVVVQGQTARSSFKVTAGLAVEVSLPEPEPTNLVPEAIPLDIVYEDGDVVVVNKPAGMVVHPAPGHPGGTLVNALLAHVPDLAGISGHRRPGIVHRLDKDTSGLIVVAKHDAALHFLAAQLKNRTMDKRYLALVDGEPRSDSGTIEAPVGRDPRHPQQMGVVASGRAATTLFRVLHRYPHHTLLECKLVTGRTHQIRVHLAAIGCPVAGDRTYGARQPTVPLERQFLHAARLTLQLPAQPAEQLPSQLAGETHTFHAPLPPELLAVLETLGGIPPALARQSE